MGPSLIIPEVLKIFVEKAHHEAPEDGTAPSFLDLLKKFRSLEECCQEGQATPSNDAPSPPKGESSDPSTPSPSVERSRSSHPKRRRSSRGRVPREEPTVKIVDFGEGDDL